MRISYIKGLQYNQSESEQLSLSQSLPEQDLESDPESDPEPESLPLDELRRRWRLRPREDPLLRLLG